MSGEELLEIMQRRRSVRSYSGEPVPMEKLNLILQAGMLAPSGRAIRPWELIVVRDKQKLIDLSSSRMGGAARMLAGADLAIAVVGDEEKSDVWTEDCCCVMENMHLMASALGVASCWIHRAKEEFESEEGKAILKRLGIEGDYEGIGNLILGYAAKPANAPAPRKADYIYRI